MYNYIIGITCLKTLKPYFRKNIFKSLNSYDFLYINTLIIVFIVFIILCYDLFFTGNNTIVNTVSNYKKLSNLQILFLIMIAFVTIISSLFLYELENNYKTPYLHSANIKIASMILLLVISYMASEKEYTRRHLIGLTLIVSGMYCLF
jgi:uncharacterized membrane protein